jgi:L-amino acid N-acyltransferase YncA
MTTLLQSNIPPSTDLDRRLKIATNIRQATVDDLDAMIRIWEAGSGQALGCELPSNLDCRSFFRQRIEGQNDCFKVWLEETPEGELTGWQSLLPFRNNPAVMHLMAESSTYISSNYQGRGVARRLLSHALSEARKSSLQWVIGFCSADNAAVLSLARSVGFEIAASFETDARSFNQPTNLKMLILRVQTS